MSRYDADDTYCYPGTDVLRNKAELTNANELDAYEGELSTLRSIQLIENYPSFSIRHAGAASIGRGRSRPFAVT